MSREFDEQGGWWLAVLHELKAPLQRMRLLLGQKNVQDLPLSVRAPLERDLDALEATLRDLHLLLSPEGELCVRRDSVDVAEFLLERQRVHALEAESAGQTLARSVPPDCPALCTKADWLVRCLDQLILNAIRHVETGATITLGAEVVSGELCLSVSDTGSGSATAEEVQGWSEPFVRGENRPNDLSGWGLGLVFVNRMVERLGGRFALSLNPGGSVRAEIFLPLPSVAPPK